MHHAEQVVGPVGQAPRSLVTEIDAGGLAEATADFVHMGIGNVHYQHGVGTEAQGAVLEHQADAAEQSDLLPLFHLLEYLLLTAADLLGQLTVRSGRQRQPGFQQAPQLQCPGFVETSVHRMSPQREAQVDTEGLLHRQIERHKAGVRLDLGEQAVDMRAVRPGQDEPEVVAMLAQVVVIDLGKALMRAATCSRRASGTASATSVLAPARLCSNTGPIRDSRPPPASAPGRRAPRLRCSRVLRPWRGRVRRTAACRAGSGRSGGG